MAARPLDMQLRHEDREDRAAKAKGINVEWQTGDQAFDEAVYVSTPGHSAEVLGALLTAEVRGAVMSLFALGFRLVHIDVDGVVRAEVTELVVARPREGRGRDAMDAFVRLLTNLPVVTASGASHAPVPFAGTTRLFAWAAGIFLVIFGALAAVPWLFSLTPSPTEKPFGFVASVVGPWVAFGLGIPAFRMAKKLHGGRVASRMRGTSRTAITAHRAGWAAARRNRRENQHAADVHMPTYAVVAGCART